MSAKNLKYSHAGYCVKRVQDVLDKPKAIPVPKKIIPNLKKILPVKGVIQDEEPLLCSALTSNEVEPRQSRALTSNEVEPNDEAELLKEDTLITVDFDNKPVNKIINKNVKKQESNNNKSDLPMYNNRDVQRPEAIIPPTYEVRMKNAREKKQEKYDKLASKAF
jgi:hypothetical protein